MLIAGRRLLPVFLLLLAPKFAAAGENYYLAVFASQSEPYHAKKTHSFATVARAVDGKVIEQHTISWLPADLNVRPMLFAKKGVNLPLKESLDWSGKNGMCVSMWGPYRITCEFYNRFVKQKACLDSGALKYRILSKSHPSLDVCDCAHALELIVRPRPTYMGLFGFGEYSSAFLVQEFRPWMIDPKCTYPQLLDALGVGCYRITPRPVDYAPSRRDHVTGHFR